MATGVLATTPTLPDHHRHPVPALVPPDDDDDWASNTCNASPTELGLFFPQLLSRTSSLASLAPSSTGAPDDDDDDNDNDVQDEPPELLCPGIVPPAEPAQSASSSTSSFISKPTPADEITSSAHNKWNANLTFAELPRGRPRFPRRGSSSFLSPLQSRSSSVPVSPTTRLDPLPEAKPLATSPAIIAPNTPGPSILRNSLHISRTLPVSFTEFDDRGVLRTHIRAVTGEPDYEARLRREQAQRLERLKLEREREKQEEKQRLKEAHRLWGLNKLGMLLGMADINFNAQMAILGGWGTGSGSMTYIPSLEKKREAERAMRQQYVLAERRQAALRKARARDTKNKNASLKRSFLARRRIKNVPVDDQEGERPEDEEEEEEEDAENGWLNAEELAAINTIINTRQSMASAQALADGTVKPKSYYPPSAASSPRSRSESLPVPPSSNTVAHHSLPHLDAPEMHNRSLSEDNVRIRFAPLPVPWVEEEGRGYLSSMFWTLNYLRDRWEDEAVESPVAMTSTASSASGSQLSLATHDLRRADTEDEVTHLDDTDAESILGDSTVPAPRHHRVAGWRLKHAHKFRRHHSDTSAMSPRNSWLRIRRSTQPVAMGAVETLRANQAAAAAAAAADSHSPVHPQSTAATDTRRPSSRRSKKSSRSRRSGSHTPRRRELDPVERQRRRNLVLAARPGGTGMVTLLDGTRIPAQRVDDLSTNDPISLGGDEWGYALLAKKGAKHGARPSIEEQTEDSPSSFPSGIPASKDVDTRVKAQEVLRRHEAEVATLGREVLAHVHHQRAKRRAATTATEPHTPTAAYSTSVSNTPELEVDPPSPSVPTPLLVSQSETSDGESGESDVSESEEEIESEDDGPAGPEDEDFDSDVLHPRATTRAAAQERFHQRPQSRRASLTVGASTTGAHEG